jgi:hypothetical protein
MNDIIQSRCGLLCAELPCRKQFSCAGCVNIATPAWGNCKIKSCCEAKNLSHCGQCPDFPCEQLKGFSYDKEHGDNGKRIEQIRAWNKMKF